MRADEARGRRGDLLKLLFERLSRLGKAVAIATSPHRFNDACGDENWLAAFVDGWLWENGVYFDSSAKSLASAPRQLHEAIGLLQEVLKSGVRAKLSEYLGSESASPDTLILSSDERGRLIALSCSTDNGGPVYRVDSESGLPSLVGVAPRLDWRFAECGSPGGAKQADASPGQIVLFVPLSEWIETLDADEVPFDYPELNHIYLS
ncbi:gag protein [Bradyrhizobium oligotrophicum S58]|uniref:Gag protein n=2 Tax=Bradyrhizobium oligotrophicum TaxID=44255 RepID=M4Z3S7_9BRAD|nr:gag protein [Bradyrhizobium oligotrophicum S58]